MPGGLLLSLERPSLHLVGSSGALILSLSSHEDRKDQNHKQEIGIGRVYNSAGFFSDLYWIHFHRRRRRGAVEAAAHAVLIDWLELQLDQQLFEVAMTFSTDRNGCNQRSCFL
ncbi:hypothetical protein Nepgr_007323 [Nepenthes gracilis]|uniref:Uncharacterized protein n=1 Tax=Nepenthes gracilis TaxID=150966 RepID=A0AAD3S6U5_NEPGR|nr:hypothetical protein Nepgr_007323 [Nepenthes gracilis]